LNQTLTSEFEAVVPAVYAQGLFNSLATIKQRPNTVTALGQTVMMDYEPIVGLENIPCMIAAQSPTTPPQTDTTRMQQQFDTRSQFHVLLDGYYPTIQQQYLAEVNGTGYEIMAVEFDSQQTMTRLATRRYSL